MPRYQINIRMDDDEDMYFYLHKKDNYSEYVKGLINKDRMEKADPKYCDQQEKYHLAEAKEWKERKKASKEDTEGVKKILEMGFDRFKEHLDSPMPIASHFKSYLRADILPKLAKARCNRFDADSLLKMYYTGEITVGGEGGSR